jgi:hypothetical protein
MEIEKYVSDMTRSQIYLTATERKFFKKIAYEQETTMSEAIRTVLDQFIGHYNFNTDTSA